MYCNINENLKQQKELSVSCQNNYECETNQCTNNNCADLQKELEETRGLIERLLNWLNNLFG